MPEWFYIFQRNGFVFPERQKTGLPLCVIYAHEKEKSNAELMDFGYFAAKTTPVSPVCRGIILTLPEM